MTPTVCLLLTVIAFLVGGLWLYHRLAFKYVEFLHERLRVADKDRDKWAEERREYATRIQGWEPARKEPEPKPEGPPPPPPVASLPQESDGDLPKEDYSEPQLIAMGLKRNSDGGFLDDYGNLWDEPQAFVGYRKWCQQWGFHESTDPREHPEWRMATRA